MTKFKPKLPNKKPYPLHHIIPDTLPAGVGRSVYPDSILSQNEWFLYIHKEAEKYRKIHKHLNK